MYAKPLVEIEISCQSKHITYKRSRFDQLTRRSGKGMVWMIARRVSLCSLGGFLTYSHLLHSWEPESSFTYGSKHILRTFWAHALTRGREHTNPQLFEKGEEVHGSGFTGMLFVSLESAYV